MNREKFWKIVDESVDADPGVTMDNLEEQLGELSGKQIKQFHDRLSEALFELDRRELARQEYRFTGAYEGRGETGDHFLYARCAVVLSGSARFAEVLSDPAEFAASWSYRAQDVLYLIEDVYEEVTDKEWEHVSPVDYETGANKAAW